MRACVWCHLKSIVRSDIQKAESLSHHYDLSIEILPLERNKCLKEGCFQKNPPHKKPWNFVGRIFWGLSRPWPLQGKMTSPAFRRSQRWNRREFLTPRRSCWCSQMPVAMTSAISEMSFQTVEDAWQLFEFSLDMLVPSIPGTYVLYTRYTCVCIICIFMYICMLPK